MTDPERQPAEPVVGTVVVGNGAAGADGVIRAPQPVALEQLVDTTEEGTAS